MWFLVIAVHMCKYCTYYYNTQPLSLTFNNTEKMLLVIIVACLTISFLTFVLKTILSQTITLRNEHVMITGGSSGIGKCLALEFASRGANVSILARNMEKLTSAKHEIQEHIKFPTQKVLSYSVDLSKNYKDIEEVVARAESQLGPVTYLINCAGYAISARFDETQIEDYQNLLNVNYLGTVYVTRAALPRMKLNRKGHILFTSSQAGLLGVYGYTAYSASKFALRGLAESLQMEVKPYNIKVTLGFPPDTDTPGFAEEEKSKPLETKLISQTSGLISPESVANVLINDVLNGKFLSSVGLEGTILTTLCAGMAPVTSVSEFVTQVFAMGIFRFISPFILYNFNRIVQKCMKDKDQTKKEF